MNKPSGNIFNLPEKSPVEYELFEEILSNNDILIERIISTGQKTPEGKWLQQDRDEWVMLLQGEAKLSFENDGSLILKKGDYIFIPTAARHRVEYTSVEPPCVWIAIHGKLK
jgi:cupin 2 domain-containing protein